MTKKSDKPKSATTETDKRKPPTACLDWEKGGPLTIEIHGDYARIRAATENDAVSDWLIGELATIGSQGNTVDEQATDFALGFLDAMKPEDPAEALLISQMAAVHKVTMVMARRLTHVDQIPQQDSAERALNKLARTYAAQMDTLKRYRTKGQQTVRVERVTVEDGGQAIVGEVHSGGRGHEEK
ncbi:hypothetical protein ACQ5SP_05455 [Rhodovulum sp. YNF3179]|uniref:hypothetical protein n=1 Tax=Rhodovulum sp. YNF3179 TaxID=3425127 RepID=UPI003D33B3B0